MNKLQITKEKLINEYFDLQDKLEFAKDLALLCRASDNMTISSERNDSELIDDILLSDEVEFYSTFVDFVKKYTK